MTENLEQAALAFQPKKAFTCLKGGVRNERSRGVDIHLALVS